ncbi:MAG TPA: 50S ribosomal protein L6 [Spirochaetaceae bacterium]|nr:50S ribosomal protein L6 [Spirochaetaceae bacterium]
MSRIGKKSIAVPAGVKLSFDNYVMKAEGPKGKLECPFDDYVGFNVGEGIVNVTRKDDSKDAKSRHGLYRQLLNNMIIGVTSGYTTNLVINGVGYKAELKGDILVLSLGYSTIIEYMIPEGIKIALDGPTKIAVSGIDKQLVGKVCAEIRSLRKPEPYKGKGIKLEKEVIRRKVGKSGVKK